MAKCASVCIPRFETKLTNGYKLLINKSQHPLPVLERQVHLEVQATYALRQKFKGK